MVYSRVSIFFLSNLYLLLDYSFFLFLNLFANASYAFPFFILSLYFYCLFLLSSLLS